jgi:hypothetical protein
MRSHVHTRLVQTVATVSLFAAGLFGARVFAQSAIVVNGTQAIMAMRIVASGASPILFRTGLRAGGTIDLATQRLPPECVGIVQRQPHYIVRFRRGVNNLHVFATSTTDLTIAVNAPDGTWHCNDNSNGRSHPFVALPHGSAGQYDIWVGTRQPGPLVPASLTITENADAHPQ